MTVDVNTVVIRLRDRYARSDVSADEAGTGCPARDASHCNRSVHGSGCESMIDEHNCIFIQAQRNSSRGSFVLSRTDYVFATHSPVCVGAVQPGPGPWLLTRD